MGIGSKGYDIQKCVMMTCDRYKDIGIYDTPKVTQRWEVMDGDTIYGDEN